MDIPTSFIWIITLLYEALKYGDSVEFLDFYPFRICEFRLNFVF
jgi:hypothetical protein